MRERKSFSRSKSQFFRNKEVFSRYNRKKSSKTIIKIFEKPSSDNDGRVSIGKEYTNISHKDIPWKEYRQRVEVIDCNKGVVLFKNGAFTLQLKVEQFLENFILM